MKKTFFAAAAVFLFALSSSFKTNTPQGVNFIRSGWSDIVREAKTQDKPIFVFIRTQECAVAHKMDAVFLNPKVAKMLNENFVCGELDPDKTMDNFRVSNWGATGVPSFAYLNKKRKLVRLSAGYENPKAMIADAQTALSKINKGE